MAGLSIACGLANRSAISAPIEKSPDRLHSVKGCGHARLTLYVAEQAFATVYAQLNDISCLLSVLGGWRV